MNNQKSIFSKIIDREIPAEIITENDDLIVIKDISPQAPIHYLIITKKNVENISKMEKIDFLLGNKIFEMANWLSKNIPGASEFKLIINNGYSSGQRVFHFHAHFMSGF
jgi:histidine triad (HIT) family protein